MRISNSILRCATQHRSSALRVLVAARRLLLRMFFKTRRILFSLNIILWKDFFPSILSCEKTFPPKQSNYEESPQHMRLHNPCLPFFLGDSIGEYLGKRSPLLVMDQQTDGNGGKGRGNGGKGRGNGGKGGKERRRGWWRRK